MKRRRHGFTLIELLTTIGIIVVLVGIVVVTVMTISSQAHTRATNVALNNLRGMLTEYEAGGGDLRKLYTFYASNSPANTESAPRVRAAATEDWDPNDATVYKSASPEPALLRTQRVMTLLLQNPKNRQVWDSLPNEAKLPPNTAAGVTWTIMMDGHGYPILFVPPGGLVNCTRGGSAWTDRSSDNRPFFVSTGSDGRFDTADNNQNSFAQH